MEKMNVKRRKTTRSFDDDDDESSNRVSERAGCWPDLPSDLMETIMSKLFFADHINLRAVCKSWNSFNMVPPLKQMPWLMVFDNKAGKHSWDSCKLVDPTYKKTYTINMSCISKKKKFKVSSERVHETKYGWLLISCRSNGNNSFFLYSPFTIDNNIIELPVLNANVHYIATFDIVLKKKKKMNKEKEECFKVVVLSKDTDQTICIRTCRSGDKSWKCSKKIWRFQLSMITCWVYSEGIFYYATHVGKQWGSYDIARNNWKQFPTSLVPELTARNNWKQFPTSFVPELTVSDFKMTKFDGEIYLIALALMNKNCQSHCSMCAYIYKFDLLKGTWESSIHNLDDRVLFVGDGYASILELDNDVKELKDQRQKVYYCCRLMANSGYRATMLKYCNGLNGNRIHDCSKWYGSFAKGNERCKRLWIDPPRHIRKSL